MSCLTGFGMISTAGIYPLAEKSAKNRNGSVGTAFSNTARASETLVTGVSPLAEPRVFVRAYEL